MNRSVLKENPEGIVLSPLIFGHEACRPSHSYGPAVRLYHLIHYVETGRGRFRILGREYTVEAGEMFVIPPQVETYYEADAASPWVYTWIGFSAGGELPCPLKDTIRCPQALEIFRGIRQCDSSKPGVQAYLTARLWDLFSLLQDSQGEALDPIETALQIIHSEYMTELNVGRLAERVWLNRSYFSTLFRERVGKAPREYLFEYRMRIAASLMTEGGRSISTAANSVGYPDLYHFSRMFKQYSGLSPREYQKQNK